MSSITSHHQTSKSRPLVRRRRASIASAIEPLEARQLLTTTLTVNTTADSSTAASGTLTLRAAIAKATKLKQSVKIVFDSKVFAAAKTIKLTDGQIVIANSSSSPVSIVGPPVGLTISGNKKFRLFFNQAGTVRLSNMTLTQGYSNGSTTIAGGTAVNDRGGAMENWGNASFTNVTFTDNQGRHDGGALNEDNRGTLTITNCTFYQNQVVGTDLEGFGGAISVYGTVHLYDSTFVGNIAEHAGAIAANNTSGDPFTVANCIFVDNTPTLNTAGDAAGTFISSGYNIINNTNESSGWIGTDYKNQFTTLNPVNFNGGSIRNFLPAAGSLAIDHGNNALIPDGDTLDARGATRISNGTVDIGAVETSNVIITPPNSTQTGVAGVYKTFALGNLSGADSVGFPVRITIDWGDSSAPTKFNQNSGGDLTMDGHGHFYNRPGKYKVSVGTADTAIGFVTPVTFNIQISPATNGSITGTIVHDADGDQTLSKADERLNGITVWLDTNDNNRIDPDETNVTSTDSEGRYYFFNLPAATYTVREKTAETKYNPSVPSTGKQVVHEAGFQQTTGINFLNVFSLTEGIITGTVFNDADGSRSKSSKEKGMADVLVFIDKNNNGKLDKKETTTTTNSKGNFAFYHLKAGAYRIRIKTTSGYSVTTPTPNLALLGDESEVSDQLFGEKKNRS